MHKKIFATSLARLIVGEQTCFYYDWDWANKHKGDYNMGYKIDYKEKTKDNPEQKRIKQEHSELLEKTIKNIKDNSKYIFREVQFWNQTKSGLFITGRTDLVRITHNKELEIYEIKTGRQKIVNSAQTAIYELYNPIKEDYKSFKVKGYVVYPKQVVEINDNLGEVLAATEHFAELLNSQKSPGKRPNDLDCWRNRCVNFNCEEKIIHPI